MVCSKEIKEDIKKNNVAKILTYGANYLARPLGNWVTKGAYESARQVAEGTANLATKKSVEELAKHGLDLSEGLNLGNPYAALTLGAWDILAESTNMRNHYSNRLVKLAGAVYFSFLTFKNLVEFASDYNNYQPLIELPFNLSMMVCMKKDLSNLYKESGKDTISDIKEAYSDLSKLIKKK